MKRFLGGLCVFGVTGVSLVFLWQHNMLPTFEELRQSRHIFATYIDVHPFIGTVGFAFLYIVIVAFSIPLATPLSVLAGFLFGTAAGTIIVVTSATLGAACIFILARYFFRDFFLEKIGSKMTNIRIGSMENGFRDILIARLIPAVPFSLINIAAGLTQVRLRDYVLATAIGIIPFSFVYVHAGMRLSEISSIKDIASSETVMFVSRIALVLVVLYLIKIYVGRQKTKKEIIDV